MTKNQFIRELREALEEMVPPSVIEENTAYYEDYFRTQMSQGKTEEEICGMLGSPRLIAKSIAEANGSEDNVYYEQSFGESQNWEQDEPRGKIRIFDLNSWKVKAGCLLFVAAMLLILYAVLHVFAAVMAVLSPVILAVLIIYLIYRMIRR